MMQTIVDKLRSDLQLSVNRLKNPSCELEARLGFTDGLGNFTPVVDHLWFMTLQRRLDACKDWKSKTHWQETEDVFFVDGEGNLLRQTRICDPDTCEMSLKTVHKKRKAMSTVSLPHPFVTTNEILPSAVNAVRVVESMESTVKADELPIVVTPTHVRIKQRKQFTLASKTCKGAEWRFELTRVWTGETREEAEQQQKQKGTNCVCEVELEFSMGTCKRINLDQLLTSMFAKITSLLN